jgi:hypothetical protein
MITEYKPNQVLTKQDKYMTDLKDIAKIIKQQLLKEYPNCIFSITIQRYSGGQSLHVSLMQSDFKVIQDFNKLSDFAIMDCEQRRYTREQIEKMQSENYHQLSQYSFNSEYNQDTWNNGVFLTLDGYSLFKRVCQIINHFNFDESDSMTDYFHVNFYLHLEIGKWNKPYIFTGAN